MDATSRLASYHRRTFERATQADARSFIRRDLRVSGFERVDSQDFSGQVVGGNRPQNVDHALRQCFVCDDHQP